MFKIVITIKNIRIKKKYKGLTFYFGRLALILNHRGGLTLGWRSVNTETPDDCSTKIEKKINIYDHFQPKKCTGSYFSTPHIMSS